MIMRNILFVICFSISALTTFFQKPISGGTV